MFFFLKLMLTMCKCTSVAIRTALGLDPAFAELSLDFKLVVPRHDPAVTLKSEGIFAHPKRIMVFIALILVSNIIEEF